MAEVAVLCRKELKDLSRSRAMTMLLAFLAAVIVLSVLVAAADYRVRLAEYNAYAEALKAAGGTPTPPPNLFPLQMLRAGIEYLEIVGSLFAVILGYGLIAKEKGSNTLQLLFTRPLGKHAFAGGKILATVIVWTVVVVALFAVVTVTVMLAGRAQLGSQDFLRLAIAAAHTCAYFIMWSLLALTLASLTRQPASGLVLALVLWLVVVLVIPQVGDTMDPDNQIPGGLFASLQVDKTHEKAIMANFGGYESARDFIEQTSATKQYERSVFAYLGIKAQYNQQSPGSIWASTSHNSLWLLATSVFAVAAAFLATTRETLLRKLP
jgi:ABC-type transport system involved in multi-copper enzyme maturation permease subunit